MWNNVTNIFGKDQRNINTTNSVNKSRSKSRNKIYSAKPRKEAPVFPFDHCVSKHLLHILSVWKFSTNEHKAEIRPELAAENAKTYPSRFTRRLTLRQQSVNCKPEPAVTNKPTSVWESHKFFNFASELVIMVLSHGDEFAMCTRHT